MNKVIYKKILIVLLFIFVLINIQNRKIISIGENDYYYGRQAIFNSLEIIDDNLLINKSSYKKFLEKSLTEIKDDHHLSSIKINYLFKYQSEISSLNYIDEIYIQIIYCCGLKELIHNYHYILEKL